MKVVVEKVPEGLKLSITYDTAKKPVVYTLSPADVNTLITILRTGMASAIFRFEYQM